MDNRLPPHSIEVEQGLLGSMLMDGCDLGEVFEQVPVEAFYDLRHREVYETILGLYTAMSPVHSLTVIESLRAKDRLDRCGGLAYISCLPDTSPSGYNASYYIGLLMGYYTRRQAIQAATEIIELAYNDGALATPDFVDRMEKSVMSIGRRMDSKKERPIKELVRDAINQIEDWQNPEKVSDMLKTGYVDLDRMMMGLKAGNMIVIAGRPGVGKTTLALNILDHVAIEQHQASGMFSLEMIDMELVMRLLCSRGRVVLGDLQCGNAVECDFPRLTGAAGKIAKAAIFIDDTPGLSILQIRSRARRWKQRHGIKLLVIDYLQLVHAVGHRDKREREVAEVSLGIKELAKELSIPVIVLSQLNRSMEREGRRPMLSDLRESGAIEQDADLVAFLYRETSEDDDPDANQFLVKLRIEKQRNGPTGQINLTFFRNISRFESCAKVEDDDVPSVKQGDNIP